MAAQEKQNIQDETIETIETIESDESTKKFVRPTYDDISLNVVSFNRSFIRNQGTVSQVVKSLEDMSSRLTEPQNEYQEGLYPKIRKECDIVVEKYSELVGLIHESNYKLFGYYLNGSRNNGSRRPTRSKNENKKYELSEYKETLNTIDARLRYIKIDCIRKSHDSTRFDQDELQKVIEFSDEFHKFIQVKLTEWSDFLDQFRKERGVEVKKHQTRDSRKTGKNFKKDKDGFTKYSGKSKEGRGKGDKGDKGKGEKKQYSKE